METSNLDVFMSPGIIVFGLIILGVVCLVAWLAIRGRGNGHK